MNRGQLEELAVRLYMLRNRYKHAKRGKPDILRRMKVWSTKVTEKTLIEMILDMVTEMEATY